MISQNIYPRIYIALDVAHSFLVVNQQQKCSVKLLIHEGLIKKLAALLASFTMILGTQSVVAEELTAEEIVDPFRTPVEGEYPVFEGSVACFVEKYNTGPYVYDISESEIIAKKRWDDRGKIYHKIQITKFSCEL